MMFLPPLLSCDELSFPLKLSYRIESFMRTLDVCLALRICGDNKYHMIHLMYVLVINLRVPPMNLCIGVGTRFRLDRTL